MPKISSFVSLMIPLALIMVFTTLSGRANTPEIERNTALTSYFSGDLDAAQRQFLNLSGSGDPVADYYLGLVYLHDDWGGSDHNKALKYLLAAADRNVSEAMWKLGDLYDNGIVVEKDPLIALDWYRKSKQQEIEKAKIIFLDSHQGQLVPISNKEAVSKIRIQAKAGNIESQVKMASIYDDGKLVERSLEKAFSWYEKAANNGNNHSALMVAYMLCRGEGVNADQIKANVWLRKAGLTATCQ